MLTLTVAVELYEYRESAMIVSVIVSVAYLVPAAMVFFAPHAEQFNSTTLRCGFGLVLPTSVIVP